MPDKVTLDFTAPIDPDIETLKVWESNNPDTGFVVIDSTSNVGEYPNYISRFTTLLATNDSDWFAISWVNAAGDESDLSAPIQGRTTTLVGKIVDRVLLRDSSLDERIVVQAAEYVISTVLHTEDPYDIALLTGITYRQLEGLTLLTMARSMVSEMTSGSSASYTAGLVSQKEDTGSRTMDIVRDLIAEGNKALGLGFTYIMLLEDIDPTGLGSISTVGIDQTRLMLEFE